MRQASAQQSAAVEDLLHRAARAVQVPDHGHSVTTTKADRASVRRQPIPILASAAAVALIAGAIVTGTALLGHDRSSPAVPAAAPSAPAPSPDDPLGQQDIDERIHEVSARIQQIAQVDDPQFDVISSDRDTSGNLTGGLTVYRADENPGRLAETYRPALAPGVSVTYRTSLLSAKQHAQLSRLVAAKQDELAQAGVMISSWGGETTPGGAFMINYDPAGRTPTAAQINQFEIFGSGTVAATTDVSVNLDTKVATPSTP